MDFDLAELIASDQPTSSLLEATRQRWPLNARAVDLASSEGTDRVRLRQVLRQLEEWSVSASGIEPAHYRDQAQVRFSGFLDQRGMLKGGLELRCPEELIEQVQMALQAHGWPAVVDRHAHLWVLRASPGEDQVQHAELGLPDADLLEMSPARVEHWLTVCPELPELTSLQQADATGLAPEQVAPWLAIASEKKESVLAGQPWRIAEWERSPLSPAEAAAWILADKSLEDYKNVEQWLQRGCSAEEHGAWLSLLASWGNKPDRVDALAAAGYTVKHALALKAAGVDYYGFEALRMLKLSPAETVAWGQCGLTSSYQVDPWRRLGINGHQLRRLLRALRSGGRDSLPEPAELEPWVAAGLELAELELWLRLHHRFLDPHLVQAWQARGLGPQEAASWAQAGVPDLEEVERWRAAHARLQEPQAVSELVAAGISAEQAALLLQKLS